MRWRGCVAYWWRIVNPIDNTTELSCPATALTVKRSCEIFRKLKAKARSSSSYCLTVWSPVTRRTARRWPTPPIWVSFKNSFAYNGRDKCTDPNLWREPDQNVSSHEPDASGTWFKTMSAWLYFSPSMKHEGFCVAIKKKGWNLWIKPQMLFL